MSRPRDRYPITRRILYKDTDNKTKLAKKTGIGLRTLYNREEKPWNTTAKELALIAKEKGLTTEEIMLILNELAY